MTLFTRTVRRLAKWTMTAIAAITLAAVLPSTAKAQETVVKVKENNTIESNGDAKFCYEIRLPIGAYTQLKKNTPNIAIIVRKLGLNGESWSAVEGIKGEWLDGDSTIRIEFMTRGVARMGKDQNWEVPIADATDTELVAVTEGVAVLTSATNIPGVGLATSTTRVTLPSGATNVKVVKPNRLAYKIPMPSDGILAKGEIDLDAKPKVMTALAKSMSNKQFSALWTAKSTFKNTGTQTLRDYKVRFRVVDYTSSWSPWANTPYVVPGQTVVDPYFPIFDMEKIGRLTGSTKAAIEMQYQYKTADGKTVEDSETSEVSLLSRNHVYYTTMAQRDATEWADMDNLTPFILASMVTHEDPIIQQAAGWISNRSGGIGSSLSDKDALKFMQAAHDFMCANLAYQTSPFGANDDKFVQHVKYGRDVLRNRAGTCIDLAILYGSLCEAVGLEPVLFSIPGHCFPAVVLPESGRLIPLESTMLKSKFEDAVKQGFETVKKMDAGQTPYTKVEIKKLHKLGVHPIDLPTLGADSLEKWGIKAPAQNAAVTDPRPNANTNTNPQPQPAPVQQHPIVGVWATVYTLNGVRVVQACEMAADGTFAVVAEANGQQIVKSGTWTVNGNKVSATYSDGTRSSGTLEWVNKNEVKYHGDDGVTLYYVRKK
jgi:hypothetical protein